MSYSDVQNNQSTSKFALVRIEPARWMNDLLTNAGGGIYTATLNGFVVSQVKENGTNLSRVSTVSGSGQYSFNEQTGAISIYPASAPSSSNSIVVFYYLFYTSQRTRSTNEDPEDSTTSIRDWLPRIETSPSVNQSIENITDGFFEIDSSTIQLINNLSEFNNYLTIYDSFYNKEVKIWYCIDSTDNIQKAFIGFVSRLSLEKNKVFLAVKNNFSRISLPALMGDSRAYNYWNLQDYSTLDPSKNSEPIPFYFGRVSRYHHRSIGSQTTAYALDPTSLPEAVCLVYSDRTDTDKNRSWGLGRVSQYGLQEDIYSISTVFHASSYTRLTISNPNTLFAGDVIKLLIGSAGTEYQRVLYVDSSNSYVFVDKATVATYTSLTCKGVSVVINQSGDNPSGWFYPYENRDYTIQFEATDSGNSLVKIVFANNFESSFAGIQVLNPSEHTIHYRLKPKNSKAGHAETLKYILSKVGGLTTSDQTFTDAESDLVTNAAFSIPYFDETDFSDYKDYIGTLLQSTLGFLTLNNNFQVEYRLFGTPSSSGTSITSHQILKDSMKAEIEYEDLIDQIVSYNPHFASVENASLSGASASSNKAKYLHGADRTIRFRHVVESMSTRITSILNLRSNRKVKYSMTTKTIALNSVVGDDYRLEYKLIDSTSSAMCKLIRADKKSNETSIILDDFYGV